MRYFLSKKKNQEIILFLIVAFLHFVLLLSSKTFGTTLGSRDAYDIWQTITTLDSNEVYGSYVLYKGFESIYPYYWLYKCSLLIGVDQFFFVKLFYATIFSYITVIGFPHFVELFLKQGTNVWRRVPFVILCFLFWRTNYSLTNMIVDLPSLAYFLLLVNGALKINNDRKYQFVYLLYIGALVGLNLCGSGQYTLATIFIVIFIIIEIIKHSRKSLIRIFKGISIFVPAILIKFYNNYFLATFVGELKEKGAWIPSASDWLNIGLTRFMSRYRVASDPQILGVRNEAIFKDYFGALFNKESMAAGGFPITAFEYLKIVLQYPLDFIAVYLNRLFILLSPCSYKTFLLLPSYLVGYIILFMTLYMTIIEIKKISDIFNSKLFIIISFFSTIIPSLVLTVDMRCGMQLQGLIFAFPIISNFYWVRMKDIYSKIKSHNYKEINIWKPVIVCIIFVLFCFMHLSTLFEIGVTDLTLWN